MGDPPPRGRHPVPECSPESLRRAEVLLPSRHRHAPLSATPGSCGLLRSFSFSFRRVWCFSRDRSIIDCQFNPTPGRRRTERDLSAFKLPDLAAGPGARSPWQVLHGRWEGLCALVWVPRLSLSAGQTAWERWFWASPSLTRCASARLPVA